MNGALSFAFAAVIVLAVLLGTARLWLRRARALPGARGPIWRAALLSALQMGAGAVLFLALFPLRAPPAGFTLAIATAGTPSAPGLNPGERLVVLPEARALRGPEQAFERAPDLATALRRHPGVTAIRVLGEGLGPRDREGLDGIRISFAAPSPPKGLVRIALPGPMAPGNAFLVAGEIGALSEGRVELIDPAGAIIAQAPLKAGEGLRLQGLMRAPGLALFELRLRDAGGRVIERLDVPIDAVPRPPPRVLLLAGAPSAEGKFLRRWAQNAGVDLALEIDAGAGVQLGDPAIALTGARLDQLDLVAIDERRWEGIGPAGRAALLSANARGMGLLLRLTGPPSLEVRRDWAALGFALAERDHTAAPAPGSAPGSAPGNAPGSAPGNAALPEPESVLPLPRGPDIIPLLEGIAAWAPNAQGRIGLLTLNDTYVLALTGRGDRHGQIWSALFHTLARAEAAPPAWLDGHARAGSRVVLCGLEGPAIVQEPGGQRHDLQWDPASGEERCAGYWPIEPGWRTLQAGGRDMNFYVHPAGALGSIAAIEATAATLSLANRGLANRGLANRGLANRGLANRVGEAGSEGARFARGPAWPWFALLLLFLAALWWLERTPFTGRGGKIAVGGS